MIDTIQRQSLYIDIVTITRLHTLRQRMKQERKSGKTARQQDGKRKACKLDSVNGTSKRKASRRRTANGKHKHKRKAFSPLHIAVIVCHNAIL